MDASNRILGSLVPWYAAQGGVEMVIVIFIAVQDQVERGDPRIIAPSSPILRSVSPETPEFWSPQGNLEPVTRKEEEVV